MSIQTVAAAHAARVRDASAAAARLRREAEELRNKADEARIEAERQRNIAACELLRNAPDCEEASGRPGSGPLHDLALARAAAAATRANTFGAELKAVSAKLAQAEAALVEAKHTELPDTAKAHLAAEARVRDAVNAVARFESDKTAWVAKIVAADPRRKIIDPASLAARLTALTELAKDPVFLGVLIGIKGIALAIELLAFIASMMLVPAEYALRRGQKLADLSREFVDRHRRQSLTDMPLQAEILRTRREMDMREYADAIFAKASESGPTGIHGAH